VVRRQELQELQEFRIQELQVRTAAAFRLVEK
jgi:hypothetical protein